MFFITFVRINRQLILAPLLFPSWSYSPLKIQHILIFKQFYFNKQKASNWNVSQWKLISQDSPPPILHQSFKKINKNTAKIQNILFKKCFRLIKDFYWRIQSSNCRKKKLVIEIHTREPKFKIPFAQ